METDYAFRIMRCLAQKNQVTDARTVSELTESVGSFRQSSMGAVSVQCPELKSAKSLSPCLAKSFSQIPAILPALLCLVCKTITTFFAT